MATAAVPKTKIASYPRTSEARSQHRDLLQDGLCTSSGKPVRVGILRAVSMWRGLAPRIRGRQRLAGSACMV